jgi:hypothetical protein
MNLSADAPIDRAAIRERLRKMDDIALLEFGQAAARMCTPEANFGAPPRPAFAAQLEECRAEWKRRHGCAGKGTGK